MTSKRRVRPFLQTCLREAKGFASGIQIPRLGPNEFLCRRQRLNMMANCAHGSFLGIAETQLALRPPHAGLNQRAMAV